MISLRRIFLESPMAAALIVLAALAARLAVPVGFMPVLGAQGVTLSLCSGYGPMPMSASGKMHHGQSDGEAKGRCAFADLTLPAVGGADPIQLAKTLLAIVAIGLSLSAPLALRDVARLRPPLRGPPRLR